MIITSRENPKIKNTAKLCGSARYRTESGLFVIEGLRLCIDAAENGFESAEFYYTSGFGALHGDEFAFLQGRAAASFEVSEDIMKKISDTVSPQGCLCVCRIPFFEIPENFLQSGKYIILENIGDPSNLGAVARTAEAFGIDAVFISGGCDIFSPKALRASMGALLRLPVFECSAVEMINKMNSCGLKTYAAVVSGYDYAVTECDFKSGCAAVIGNEASGLTEETSGVCTFKVTVPMSGRAESLNAASAATILIWEMVR